jgi:hypothetical protein
LYLFGGRRILLLCCQEKEAAVFCPICEKRKPARFCPAKGEKICAVCCGTEREVTIDCPMDCVYLLAARRYEDEHPRSIPADAPFLNERLPSDVVHTHQHLMAATAYTLAKFSAEHPAATDADALAALRSVAETYRTLISGIYYENPPNLPVQRELYVALRSFVDELKQKAAAAGSGSLRDTDVFGVLVFLFRMGLLRTNGRPRSRRFIAFLRSQFTNSEERKREESHIITP